MERRLSAGRSDVACVLLVAAILGSSRLVDPLGRDQGTFASGAAAMLEGKALYRDICDIKPPLTCIVYLTALCVFGVSTVAIRLLDLVWQAITALILRSIASRMLGSRSAAVAAACLYLLGHFANSFFHTAQTDGFQNLPAAVAVALVIGEKDARPGRKSLLAGFALGAAALFKYPIAILLPLLALAARVNAARRLLVLSAGFAVALAAGALFLASTGGLASYIDIQTGILPHYVAGGRDPLGRLRGLARFLDLPWALCGAAFAIELAAWLRGERGPVRTAVLVWWLAALLGLVAQGRFWIYHWLPLLPPSAILAATVALRLCRRFALLAPAMAIALAVAAVLACGPGWQRTAEVVTGRSSLESVQGRFLGSNYSVGSEIEVARYLREHTRPGEPVFVWGFQPAVYFLAGRPCASRFYYDSYLLPGGGWPEALQEELLADLEARPPAMIVVAAHPVRGVARLAPLFDLIEERYRVVKRIPPFTIHARE